MTAALLIIEAVVIVAAFVGTIWLRRVSDRAWAQYASRRAFARLATATVTITASTAAFSAALAGAARAATEFQATYDRITKEQR